MYFPIKLSQSIAPKLTSIKYNAPVLLEFTQQRLMILLLALFCLSCLACSSNQKPQEDSAIAELSSAKQNKRFGHSHSENRELEDGNVDETDASQESQADTALNEVEVLSHQQRYHQAFTPLPKASREEILAFQNQDQDQAMLIELHFEKDQTIKAKMQCEIKEHSHILLSLFEEKKSRFEIKISRLFPRLMIELSSDAVIKAEEASKQVKPRQMKMGELYFDLEDQHLHLLEKPMPWHLDQLIYLGDCTPHSTITYLNRQPIDIGHAPASSWQVILEGIQAIQP